MSKLPAKHQRRSLWPDIAELFRGFAGWGDLRPMFDTHLIRLEDEIEDGRYVVRAELPGIDPAKDVEITVRDGEMPGVGGPAHSWSEVPRRRSFACWRAGMVGSMLYLVRRLQRWCFADVQATPDQQENQRGSGGNASCVRMTLRPMRCRSWPI